MDRSTVSLVAAAVWLRVVLPLVQPASPRCHLSELAPFTDALRQRGAHLVLNMDTDELASQLTAAHSYVVISPCGAFSPADLVLSLLEPFGLNVNADHLHDLNHCEGNFCNLYLNAVPG